MEIQATETFRKWMLALRDRKAAAIINARVLRVANGLLGDVKSVGERVRELRVDVGPGYRIYFTRRGQELIILLCGGDKGTQDKDIKHAQALGANL